MAFDPFESKYAKAIMPKICKGKSLKTFGKTFEEVVTAKVSEPNYETGGVSVRLGEECIALAEIVAVARGILKRGLLSSGGGKSVAAKGSGVRR